MRWGFRLLGISYRVLRESPGLFGIVFLGCLGSAAVSFGAFYALYDRMPSHTDLEWPRYLVALPVLWLGSYVGTFCNAVVVATVSLRFRGRPASTADGLRLALTRLPHLLLWNTVSLLVGYLLHILAERLKLGGAIARWVLDISWGLATALIIPVLVIEGESVGRGIRRSSTLFRKRWGASVTAHVSVAFTVFVIAAFVACPLTGLAFLVSVPVGLTTAVASLAAILVISGAFGAVLTAALYEYAADTGNLGPFTESELATVWRVK